MGAALGEGWQHMAVGAFNHCQADLAEEKQRILTLASLTHVPRFAGGNPHCRHRKYREFPGASLPEPISGGLWQRQMQTISYQT